MSVVAASGDQDGSDRKVSSSQFNNMCIRPNGKTNLIHDNDLELTFVMTQNHIGQSMIHVLKKNRRILVLKMSRHQKEETICSLEILKTGGDSSECELLIGMTSGMLYYYAFDCSKARMNGSLLVKSSTSKKNMTQNRLLDLSVDIDDLEDDIVVDDEEEEDGNEFDLNRSSLSSNKRRKTSTEESDQNDLKCNVQLATSVEIINDSHMICNFGKSIDDMKLFISKSKGKGRRIISVYAFHFERSFIFEIADIKKSLKNRFKKKIKFQTTQIQYPSMTSNKEIACVSIVYPKCLMEDQSKMKAKIRCAQYIDDSLYKYLFGQDLLLLQTPICIISTSLGSIYFLQLNQGQSDASLLLHWKDCVKCIGISSTDPTQTHSLNILSFVGRKGSVSCIYAIGGEKDPKFIHKQFSTTQNVVDSIFIRNHLVILDEHMTLTTYQLSESDRINNWLPPGFIHHRELVQSKNTIALCRSSDDHLISMNQIGRIYRSNNFTKDSVDKTLGSTLSVINVQQGIRRLYPLIENSQNVLELDRTHIRIINNDIESLNNAMHILALAKQSVNMPVQITAREADFHCARNTRYIDISIKNLSGFKLMKHWNIFIVLSDSTMNDSTSRKTENFCFPMSNLMLGSEWTQSIQRTLPSYSPTHISVYICFKMPEHEKGFSLLIHESILDCWDFIVRMPDSSSLLDDSDPVQTIDNQMYQIIQQFDSNGSQQESLSSNSQKTIQTLKFLLSNKHESNLQHRLRLSVGTSVKYMTHMGDLVSIQLRRIVQSDHYEVILHSCSQQALLFIKQALLSKLLLVSPRSTTFKLSPIAQGTLVIPQSALDTLIAHQNSLLILQDTIDTEIRYSMNHDKLINTTLRQMNQLYDQLMNTYNKMRSVQQQHSIIY